MLAAIQAKVPRIFQLLVAAFIFCIGLSNAYAAQHVKLDTVSIANNNVVKMRGQFGEKCSKCYVEAVYSPTFKYRYQPRQWNERNIQFEALDLNEGFSLKLRVVTSAGFSEFKKVALFPIIIPSDKNKKPVSSTFVDSRTFFERRHDLKVGEKGEDSFEVSSKPAACNTKSNVFDHASIVYRDNRFSNAQIIQLPKNNCIKCKPLKVRWYNEPTGRLIYQLHVFRRQVYGACKNKILR